MSSSRNGIRFEIPAQLIEQAQSTGEPIQLYFFKPPQMNFKTALAKLDYQNAQKCLDTESLTSMSFTFPEDAYKSLEKSHEAKTVANNFYKKVLLFYLSTSMMFVKR